MTAQRAGLGLRWRSGGAAAGLRRGVRALASSLALLAALPLLAACNAERPEKDEVQYAAFGTACSASIVYLDANGLGVALPKQSLPWDLAFPLPATQISGKVLLVSATSDCDRGTLTAAINVNGAPFTSSAGFGAFVVVTAARSL